MAKTHYIVINQKTKMPLEHLGYYIHVGEFKDIEGKIRGSGITSKGFKSEKEALDYFRVRKFDLTKVTIYTASTKQSRCAESKPSATPLQNKDSLIPVLEKAADEKEFLALLDAHKIGLGDYVANNGMRIVHLAAWRGFNQALTVLHAAKVDLNVADSVGRTPLYYAVSFGHYETTRLLLMSGADQDKGADDKMRPVQLLTAFHKQKNPLPGSKIISATDGQRFSELFNKAYGHGITLKFAADANGNHRIINQVKFEPREGFGADYKAKIETAYGTGKGHLRHRVPHQWIAQRFTEGLVRRDYRAVDTELRKYFPNIGAEAGMADMSTQATANLAGKWFEKVRDDVTNVFRGEAEGNMAQGWLQQELFKAISEDGTPPREFEKEIPSTYLDYFASGKCGCELVAFVKYVDVTNSHGTKKVCVIRAQNPIEFLKLWQLGIIDSEAFVVTNSPKSSEQKAEMQSMDIMVSRFGHNAKPLTGLSDQVMQGIELETKTAPTKRKFAAVSGEKESKGSDEKQYKRQRTQSPLSAALPATHLNPANLFAGTLAAAKSTQADRLETKEQTNLSSQDDDCLDVKLVIDEDFDISNYEVKQTGYRR